MSTKFDHDLFRLLKSGLADLSNSEKRAFEAIWKYPNEPLWHLPIRLHEKPSGSLWLKIGNFAKRRLWDRMPARIKKEYERPGRPPFYSGPLVKLYFVEDTHRRRWTVSELRDETVKALQALNVIGSRRYPPSKEYKPLDDTETDTAPSGFSALAET